MSDAETHDHETFYGTRLTAARERRGMTMTALAAAAGLSPRTLSRYENGTSVDPEPGALEAIASVLACPVDFFFREPTEEVPEEGVSFRSLKKTPAKQKAAMRRTAGAAWELERWIAERYSRPDAAVPDLGGMDPEVAAATVRAEWGLGVKPIPHLIRLLESKGVRVYAMDPSVGGSMDGHNISGLSVWLDGDPYIFLSTSGTAERQRMSAAHELGHLVLHRHGAIAGREAEDEANRFAGALLVPGEDLLDYTPRATLDAIIRLKKRWGVSAIALIYRMKEEGLIPQWRYQDLCIRLRATYGSDEPAEGERERSHFWPKLFNAMREDGIARRDVARHLGVDTHDIDALVRSLAMVPVPGRASTHETPDKPKLRVAK